MIHSQKFKQNFLMLPKFTRLLSFSSVNNKTQLPSIPHLVWAVHRCSAVQCTALHCIAVQYSALQSSAVQCSAVQCSDRPPPAAKKSNEAVTVFMRYYMRTWNLYHSPSLLGKCCGQLETKSYAIRHSKCHILYPSVFSNQNIYLRKIW